MSQLIMNQANNIVADKVAHIKKPEADLTDVDLKHVSRDSVTFNSKVSVHNPYDHAIPICEISYTFKSANKTIATGTIPDPGSLLANEQTFLDVPVKVAYRILMDLAMDIGSDWDIDYTMEVGLTMDLPILGNVTIPLSKKGQLRLPTLSDIF